MQAYGADPPALGLGGAAPDMVVACSLVSFMAVMQTAGIGVYLSPGDTISRFGWCFGGEWKVMLR